PQLDRAAAQTAPRAADEESRLARPHQPGTLHEPLLERADRHAPDRHHARLAPLAENLNRTVAQIEMAEVEPDDLREPQPRGVEQLHDGPVARGEGLACRDVEQACHLIGIQRLRQASRSLRRPHVLARIAANSRDLRLAVTLLAFASSAAGSSSRSDRRLRRLPDPRAGPQRMRLALQELIEA